jgi:hypothetical protein
MNNKINELFQQAYLDAAVPNTSALLPSQLSRLKSKFAELLVKECCEHLRDINGPEFAESLENHFSS